MLLYVKTLLFLALLSWDIVFSVDTFPEYCKDTSKFNQQIDACKKIEEGVTDKDLNLLCEKKLEVAECMEKTFTPCDNETKAAFMAFLNIPQSAQHIEKCQEADSILKKMNGKLKVIDSSSTVTPPVTVPAGTSAPEKISTTPAADNSTDPGKLNTTEPNAPQTSDGTQETTVSGSKAKYNLTAFAVFTVLLVLKILDIESSQNL